MSANNVSGNCQDEFMIIINIGIHSMHIICGVSIRKYNSN